MLKTERLDELLQANNGYICTADVETAGVSRSYFRE
jgi:hypothetical protein